MSNAPVFRHKRIPPTTGEVVIRDEWSTVDEMGFLTIYGLVENRTREWIQCFVTFKFYEADGRPLAVTGFSGDGPETGTLVGPGHIPPGGLGAYEWVKGPEDIHGAYGRHESAVIPFVVEPSPRLEIGDVKIAGEDADSLEVTGTVANAGDAQADAASVVAVGFDARGRLTWAADAVLKDGAGAILTELPAGCTARFEVTPLGACGEIKDVRLVAGCGEYHFD